MMSRSASVATLCCLVLSALAAVSAQTTTGQLYYYEYPDYSCGSIDATDPPVTDTVAVVSAADLKSGNSCFQCIQVTPIGANIPQFTAQLVSSADGISGTDLGVAMNFGGVYSVSYTFISCSSATKLIGTTTSPSSSPTPTATASPSSSPTATATASPSSSPSQTATASPASSPTPTASAAASVTSSPSPTSSPSLSSSPSPSPATVSAAASTNTPDGSAAEATCTGQGTYYSEVNAPSTFYCAGNGLNSGYPGLPTVAMNGADMTDSSCGQCVVIQGTGITEATAAAEGQGTTPFPAVPTYATINNKCPECSHCDIDYYVGYTQTKNGRYTITWDYIDCATALSEYNAQTGGSRKLLRSTSLTLNGPRVPLA